MPARIAPFFEKTTETFSYIVADPSAKAAAIIDPVLDYDPAAGRVGTHSADAIIRTIEAEGLTTVLILDTHVHADHLTAAAYLKKAWQPNWNWRQCQGGPREFKSVFWRPVRSGAGLRF